MSVSVRRAKSDQKPVLAELMQSYLEEMSEFTGDAVNDEGVFDLGSYFDLYWRESTRHPFTINSCGAVVGFALVREVHRPCFEMAEFFILPKYRRTGIGSAAALALFGCFEGNWRVAQHDAARAAQSFWRAVIDRFTEGNFEECRSTQPSCGPMQIFSSSAGRRSSGKGEVD